MHPRFLIPLVTIMAFYVSLIPAQANDFVTEDTILSTPTGKLFGTLLTPAESNKKVPVVLLIAGSGPTDRNGNSSIFPSDNNSLKQMAEGLAQQGVASLRYDKRGIAASAGAAVSERHLRFGQSVDDARRWCDLLADDERFSAIIVAGHGQGSLVGMNASWEAGVDGFASLAGAGHRVCDVLRAQLHDQFAIRSRVRLDKILSELEKGRTVEEPPSELSILFRPSIQPFLISWQRYDPLRDIARLQMPLLILQGTTDLQVGVENAELLAEACPEARLVLLEGYNHIFKPVAGDDPVAHQRSLADSTLIVSPELIEALVQLAKDSESAVVANTELLDSVHLFNLGLSPTEGASKMEKHLSARVDEPVASNIGFWARYFVDRPNVIYCFGPHDGGYVAQGALVLENRQDCVSLLYRCSELARSKSLVESVDWALRSRFAGADLASFVGTAGNVNYDHPAHLDFSLDMIRSGIWGFDVTPSLAGAVVDEAGTSRYPAGSFSYVDSDSLDLNELLEGDVAWFVLDSGHKKAARMRDKYGLVIGHIGLVVVENGEPWLVHAASSDLDGYYKGGTVVKVPLQVYLNRVDKFAGIMVTRF